MGGGGHMDGLQTDFTRKLDNMIIAIHNKIKLHCYGR